MSRARARSRIRCSPASRPRRPGARRGQAEDLLRCARRRRQDLRDARGGARRQPRRDVVVGYVEPHGRPETEALLEGLEQLPPLPVEYRGMTLPRVRPRRRAARRPGASPRRRAGPHQRRGRSAATHASAGRTSRSCSTPGIDVWTTLNVQHSRASTTSSPRSPASRRARRARPRPRRADEIELVDLPPDELIERLQGGQGLRARAGATRRSSSFFRKGNLVALRELALRRTADRVDADVRELRAIADGLATLAGARTNPRLRSGRTPRPSARARAASASPTRSTPSGSAVVRRDAGAAARCRPPSATGASTVLRLAE